MNIFDILHAAGGCGKISRRYAQLDEIHRGFQDRVSHLTPTQTYLCFVLDFLFPDLTLAQGRRAASRDTSGCRSGKHPDS